MTEISAKVFLGNSQDAKQSTALKAIGITNVVVLGSELPSDFVDRVYHSKYEIQDHAGFDFGQHFEDILDYIDDSLDRGGKVLIQGETGDARAYVIGLLWLMHNDRFNLNQATLHLNQIWADSNPNPGFWNQLKRFEAGLKGKDPNFGKTIQFSSPGNQGSTLDRQPHEYTNHLDLNQGFDNTQRNESSQKVNQFLETEGPHTDFWDLENKTFDDKKQTFRYKKGHHNRYQGEIPVDDTVSNKYYTKNPGLIKPLKPKYQKYKNNIKNKRKLEKDFSEIGLRRATKRQQLTDLDEKRGHHVYQISSNEIGRGLIKRGQKKDIQLKKSGDHLALTSFKDGNFGF